MNNDPYKILGVARGATLDEIKSAYRKLASQHHPDKGGDTAKFQEIQAAYAKLSDSQSKPGSGDDSDFRSFDDWMKWQDRNDFEDLLKAFKQREARRNRDVEVGVTLELKDSLQDHEKVISVLAGGSRKTVTVTIPKGIEEGRTIRFRGLGDNSFADAAAGDLYVHIRYSMPSDCRYNNGRLEQTIEVGVLDAMTNEPVSFKTALGENLVIDFPSGFKANQIIRVKEKGPLVGVQRTDIYLRVVLVLPSELDQESINLLKQVKNRTVNS